MSDSRDREEESASASDIDAVRILYEEGPCLAVFKPGGLLTQAPPGIDSLELQVARILRDREGTKGGLYLAAAHRIDRPASGVVLMGRHRRAVRRLADQFAGRMVEKEYWAILEGRLAAPSGRWRDWVAKRPNEAHVDVLSQREPRAKRAEATYRTLSVTERFTWVAIDLETGRTHQIRVQAASRGAPVLGDHQYGASSGFGPEVSDARQRWIALHARRLVFRHPMTRNLVEIVAPLPSPWRHFDPAGDGAVE